MQFQNYTQRLCFDTREKKDNNNNDSSTAECVNVFFLMLFPINLHLADSLFQVVQLFCDGIGQITAKLLAEIRL